MENNFPLERLGDHCQKIGSGATPRGGKEVYLDNGECVLIRSQNVYNNQFEMGGLVFISEEAANKLNGVAVEENDALLNITGDSVARCCTVPCSVLPARVNQHVAIIRTLSEELDPLFIRYFLVSPNHQDHMLKLASSGATRNALTKVMIEDFQVPKPDINVQRAIAKILGGLDDKIDLLREMNATLENIARSLFRAWFVDFEPARAKAAGATGFRGMPQELFEVLPDSFEESEIGEIPKGWEVTPLSEILAHPRRSEKPTELNKGTPYIGLEHMPRRSIALAEWETAEKVTSNKHRFHKNELLFGKLRPNFHKVGIAFVDGVCSTDIVVLAPKTDELHGLCLGYVSSDDFVDYNVAASSGTKMPRTNWDTMSRYQVAMPDNGNLVSAFNDISKTVIEKLEANSWEVKTLIRLRDTLLPKLISGEIEAPDLEVLADGG